MQSAKPDGKIRSSKVKVISWGGDPISRKKVRLKIRGDQRNDLMGPSTTLVERASREEYSVVEKVKGIKKICTTKDPDKGGDKNKQKGV